MKEHSSPILFIHIPKTATTTVRQIVYNNVPPNEIEELYHDGEPTYQPGQTQLIIGHFRYGLHEKLGVSPNYVTFLRNPVDQLYSRYRHYHRSPVERHQQILAACPDFSSFCSHPEAYNHQTRILSGFPTTQRTEDLQETHAQQAAEHIKAMPVIGLVEQFDQSLLLFQHYLGWNKLRYHTLNKDPFLGNQWSTLASEEVKAAEAATQWDRMLYAEAQKRFQQLWESIPGRTYKYQRQLLEQRVFRWKESLLKRGT